VLQLILLHLLLVLEFGKVRLPLGLQALSLSQELVLLPELPHLGLFLYARPQHRVSEV
jgi:hypothetical protein